MPNPESPRNFIDVTTNGNTLYLPEHVAGQLLVERGAWPADTQLPPVAPYELKPGVQEMRAQNEVIGTYGLGSLRNESVSDKVAEKQAEDLDKAIQDMLDPRNILDLKANLDHRAERIKDESTVRIDRRLDKDGSKQAAHKQTVAELKQQLIGQYTQTGLKKGEHREVPEKVTTEIAQLMNLSYKELESRAAKRDAEDQERANQAKPAPVEPDASKAPEVVEPVAATPVQPTDSTPAQPQPDAPAPADAPTPVDAAPKPTDAADAKEPSLTPEQREKMAALDGYLVAIKKLMDINSGAADKADAESARLEASNALYKLADLRKDWTPARLEHELRRVQALHGFDLRKSETVDKPQAPDAVTSKINVGTTTPKSGRTDQERGPETLAPVPPSGEETPAGEKLKQLREEIATGIKEHGADFMKGEHWKAVIKELHGLLSPGAERSSKEAQELVRDFVREAVRENQERDNKPAGRLRKFGRAIIGRFRETYGKVVEQQRQALPPGPEVDISLKPQPLSVEADKAGSGADRVPMFTDDGKLTYGYVNGVFIDEKGRTMIEIAKKKGGETRLIFPAKSLARWQKLADQLDEEEAKKVSELARV